VRLLCQLVEVPASGYYAWQQSHQQVVGQMEPAWETTLIKVFRAHKRCYGTRRLHVELRRKGYRVGWQRLRTAMRRRSLLAPQPKAFVPRTTDSTHELRCAPNQLLNQPKPTQADRISVSDITRICHWPTMTGLICAPFRIWLVSRSRLAGRGHYARKIDDQRFTMSILVLATHA
jgi:putative transposase